VAKKEFRARDKFNCSRCGRSGTIRGGYFIGGPSGRYICKACSRKEAIEEAKQRVQDWVKSGPQPPSKEEIEKQENRRIVLTLKELVFGKPNPYSPQPYYPQSGWYQLKELTSLHNSKFTKYAIDGRRTSEILHRLGFTEYKIGAHGYTYVWINVDNVERLKED